MDLSLIQLPTTLGGERVVAVFPVIGNPGEWHSAEVITCDPSWLPAAKRTFTVYRYTPTTGGGRMEQGRAFTTFPSALRAARQACGWG